MGMSLQLRTVFHASLRTLRSNQRDQLTLDQDNAFPQGLLEFAADGTEIFIGGVDGSGVDLENRVLILLLRAGNVGRVAGAHPSDGRGMLDVERGTAEVADEGFLDGVEIVLMRH